jgi:cellulose synthase/poly-beta-1,6-N-acetylglucosamine synthase-like glycosyltransferase
MTSLPETLILVLYFFVLSILAIYGWHRYYLVYLYMKNRDKAPGRQTAPPLASLPPVTIQLPIYNEMYVADRLIDAVCEMDYPRELLEIQVLDDSTDETTDIAELAVRRHAARGFDIKVRSRRGCARPRPTTLRSSTLISSRRRTSCVGPCRTSPTPRSAWCRPAGAISTRITRC